MQKSVYASGIGLVVAALAISGCTSSRFGTYQTRPAPAPIASAPAGTVTSGQLPPPAQPGAAATDQGGYPDAPGADSQDGMNSDMNSDTNSDMMASTGETGTDGSVQQVTTSAPVSREQMVGAWKVSTGGSSCQMFMALTKWTGGFRAASRGCPGDAASVSAWDVDGQQVVLSDSNGNKVATLFSSGNGQFSGQTKGGAAITLSR